MNNQTLLDTLQLFCPRALPVARAAIDAGLARDTDDWREALVTVLDHLQKHDEALQSLTPGGSEYVNDRERCVRFARERFLAADARGREWHAKIPRLVTTGIMRVDPCGTAWRQPDGSLYLELDHSGGIINIPAIEDSP